MVNRARHKRLVVDPFLRATVLTAVGLAVAHGIVRLFWIPGTVVGFLPVFAPTINGFLTLAALSIAFLAFGRHRVLGDAASFWIGLAFCSHAVSTAFYVVTLPGLLPSGQSLLARLPNTSVWLGIARVSTLAILLAAATASGWARPVARSRSRRIWVAVATLLAVALFGVLSIFFEQFLPTIIVDGRFTPLQEVWAYAVLLVLAAGAVVSASRYRQNRDSLFGYASLLQVSLVFYLVASIASERRYDLFWYWLYVPLVGGFLVMLFGLLSEYVQLYGRERQRTREAEELYAELDATVSAIVEGVVVYDTKGQIVRLNPAAQRLLGYSAEERELSLAERVALLRVETADGKPLLWENLPAFRALRGETVQGLVVALHPRSGKTIWISGSGAPIRAPDGTLQGAVTVFTDITALHQLQEQREDFVGMVSHDLRAPLAIILGRAELLERALPASRAAEAERLSAESIITSAKRINAMIEELVESVRLESGQIKLEMKPVDLGVFLCEWLERAKEMIDVDRIDLDFPPALPPVLADPDRLERIFTNLLTNALKYSPLDARVVVRASRVGDEMLTAVADKGVGIAPEDLPRLFERFYRARRTSEAEGLGLGLYITRMLVEAHDGRIWVESEPGRGSTFYFSLPVAPV